jgi:hypothetical protein
MRYLALTGGIKPHLLQMIDNGRGATTTLTWRASTEFYVADRRAGTPWVTRLPFPVQVVAQVDVVDAVTGDQLTTRYVYHHGFYDGVEREFRGFGMVEQFDAEAIDPNHAEGASGGATANVLTMPPIHTKTWFHTGAFLDGPMLDEAYAAEYYQLPGVFVASLPDCLFENLLSSLDARQATRALAGMMLRQEIYADDGAVDGGGSPLSGIPFTVTAHNYHVKALQAATAAEYGIYITRPRETLTCHLERDPSDPRFQHDVVIAGDDYGNVTDRVTLAYPRRTAMLEGVAGQDQVLATYRHDDVVNVPGELDWYRVGAIFETRTWEVQGFLNAPTPPLPLTVSAPAYTFAVVAQAQSTAAIAFESSFDPSLFQRRLIADAQVFYRADDGSTELPLGQIASRGLLSRNRRMAFSPTLLNIVFDANHVLPAGLLTSAGYELDVGQYWARSASATYGASIFYQPNAFADPFGNSSSAGYDAFSLFVTSVTDALSNTMSVAMDSRTLQPRLLSDVNGNQSLAAYDPLGRLVAIAVQGKPPTGGAPPAEGDTLASPTTQFTYHLESIPSYVVRQARETAQYPDHAGQPPDYRYSFTYYDGFGREVMTKVEDDDGQPATQMSTKWVGTGRTVFNNKGKPVKQYEPYFASTNAFESEQAVTQAGVTDVLAYDAIERLIRVDHPNGTFALTTFDVWTQSTYDENDTLAGHGPNAWWTQNGVTPSVSFSS